MSIDVLKKNLADIRSEINVQQAMLNVTISEIDRKKQEINKLLKKNGQLELASIVYGQAGKQARESARIIFEQIVTNALQYITQNKDYKFIIEESTTRSKPSYEFYVESKRRNMQANPKRFWSRWFCRYHIYICKICL